MCFCSDSRVKNDFGRVKKKKKKKKEKKNFKSLVPLPLPEKFVATESVATVASYTKVYSR